MKKRALFFDCFYSFTPLLSPLSLSKFHIINKKIAKAKATVSNSYLVLAESAFNGHLNASLYFIRWKGNTDFNLALRNAALGGHLKLCKYFIKMGATNFNQALANAAKRGHLDLCKYFVTCSASATDLNLVLANAALGGHIDLCDYLIKCGATKINWAIQNAKDQTTKDFLAGLIQAQNEKKGLVL